MTDTNDEVNPSLEEYYGFSNEEANNLVQDQNMEAKDFVQRLIVTHCCIPNLFETGISELATLASDKKLDPLAKKLLVDWVEQHRNHSGLNKIILQDILNSREMPYLLDFAISFSDDSNVTRITTIYKLIRDFKTCRHSSFSGSISDEYPILDNDTLNSISEKYYEESNALPPPPSENEIEIEPLNDEQIMFNDRGGYYGNPLTMKRNGLSPTVLEATEVLTLNGVYDFKLAIKREKYIAPPLTRTLDEINSRINAVLSCFPKNMNITLSISDNRFIQYYSGEFSDEILAHTIGYFKTTRGTPWYNEKPSYFESKQKYENYLEDEFYKRVEDVTLSNGAVVTASSITENIKSTRGFYAYAIAYNGLEKDIALNAAWQFYYIKNVIDPVEIINNNFHHENFIDGKISRFGIKSSSAKLFNAYEDNSFLNKKSINNRVFKTHQKWREDIDLFKEKLKGYEKNSPIDGHDSLPLDDLYFDEVFYLILTHYRKNSSRIKALNPSHRHVNRLERLYVYRGFKDRDYMYSCLSGSMYSFKVKNGKRNNHIILCEDDIPEEHEENNIALYREIHSMARENNKRGMIDYVLVLPIKKEIKLLNIAERRTQGSCFPYEIEDNGVVGFLRNTDLDTMFKDEINDQFSALYGGGLMPKIKKTLDDLSFMRVHCEDLGDIKAIKKWLTEFSNGKRVARFRDMPLLRFDYSKSNPSIFYIPLNDSESERYNGLMVNWIQGNVFPLPRDPLQLLELFKKPSFRMNYHDISRSAIDSTIREFKEQFKEPWVVDQALVLKEQKFITLYNMVKNVSKYVSAVMSLKENFKSEWYLYERSSFGFRQANLFLDYSKYISFGLITPSKEDLGSIVKALCAAYSCTSNELPLIIEKKALRYWTSSESYNIDINSSYLLPFDYQKYHLGVSVPDDMEIDTLKAPDFAFQLLFNLKNKLLEDWDYNTTSLSEQANAERLERIRPGLSFLAYFLSVALCALIPGILPGVILGMMTTYLTDTLLDILELENTDDPIQRDKLIRGVMLKSVGSLAAELGGANMGSIITSSVIKWMTRSYVANNLGEEALKKIIAQIDKVDDEVINGMIINARSTGINGDMSRFGLPTRIRKVGTVVQPAIDGLDTSALRMRRVGAVKPPEMAEISSLLSNRLKGYTITAKDIMIGGIILTIVAEMTMAVERAILPEELTNNAFYQAVRMIFVYSGAAFGTALVSQNNLSKTLGQAMNDLGIPSDKQTTFFKKINVDEINLNRLLKDPLVKKAFQQMNSPSTVTTEYIGPSGRRNTVTEIVATERGWGAKETRLLKLDWLADPHGGALSLDNANYHTNGSSIRLHPEVTR